LLKFPVLVVSAMGCRACEILFNFPHILWRKILTIKQLHDASSRKILIPDILRAKYLESTTLGRFSGYL